MSDIFDVLVVGGGINGVGIVCDVVGCGLLVCLCEQDDFVVYIFSVSIKFVYGGLCYLCNGEFVLVCKVFNECEIVCWLVLYLVCFIMFVLLYVLLL